MLFGNKKKHTGIISNNMDESYNYAEWKKSDKKRVYIVHKIQENVNSSTIRESRWDQCLLEDWDGDGSRRLEADYKQAARYLGGW